MLIKCYSEGRETWIRCRKITGVKVQPSIANFIWVTFTTDNGFTVNFESQKHFLDEILALPDKEEDLDLRKITLGKENQNFSELEEK